MNRAFASRFTEFSSKWPPGLLLIATLLFTGCQPGDSSNASADSGRKGHVRQVDTGLKTPATPTSSPSVAPEHEAANSRAEVSSDVPVVATLNDVAAPDVLLSADHQATCRVYVGDTFPDVSLNSLDGEPRRLSSLLGERLTVVVFWDLDQPMSVEQIRRLNHELRQRFQESGVSVVTINVGDSADAVRKLLENLENGVTDSLLDPNGDALAQVATGLLPRTYLLRKDRRIVWLDLEYSRSSRDELQNAIRYTLKQFVQQANQGIPSRG